jgi:ribonuclease BN (tRNA processing enzyme)
MRDQRGRPAVIPLTWILNVACALVGISSMAPLGASAERAKVVLLGSGTPIPDPSSSGPAVAVVVNGRAYLFDAGAGVVRRAQAAAEKFGMPALDATNLTRLFLTHLHSDHTLGYPDLILTPWVVGRREPLEVYGPEGTAAMTEHLKAAYAADIKVRTEGMEGLNTRGLRVNVHEIQAGQPVYRDANITVRAIPVRHGSWHQAFAYAMDAGGRTIVISGDTAPATALEEACQGCDVLVHEVYSANRFKLAYGSCAGQYHASFHTSTEELARLAAAAKPKLLVLYHQLYCGPRERVDLKKEIRQTYSGNVVNGRDLTVY